MTERREHDKRRENKRGCDIKKKERKSLETPLTSIYKRGFEKNIRLRLGQKKENQSKR